MLTANALGTKQTVTDEKALELSGSGIGSLDDIDAPLFVRHKILEARRAGLGVGVLTVAIALQPTKIRRLSFLAQHLKKLGVSARHLGLQLRHQVRALVHAVLHAGRNNLIHGLIKGDSFFSSKVFNCLLF